MIKITNISRALSDPIRYKILLFLIESIDRGHTENLLCEHHGVCNCEIMAKFDMIQSRVSYHMKELVETGLVKEESKGKWKYYVINKEALREYTEELKTNFKL